MADDEEIAAVLAAIGGGFVAVNVLLQQQQRRALDRGAAIDHRVLPRDNRRHFHHQEASKCIYRDYLGPNPLMGAEFVLMFRITRPRFQCLMEDVMAADLPYYNRAPSNNSLSVDMPPLEQQHSCLEARLLLPLKSLCYGVPSHCFTDYFQMSQTFAREACFQFDQAIIHLYKEEYLRIPTAKDLKSITTLHKSIHKVDGMFGSLDCSHTYWKNCPKGWHGSFKGKDQKPSLVLEAISDYHLFFWHVSYGYAGTLNDLNILSLSPFMDQLLDGSFCDLEKEAGVVPFHLDQEEQFNKLFILVDGIYPKYSRFVRGIKQPITREQKKFTGWQEAARKDIERAFGVLKGKWQFLDRPIHLQRLDDISGRVHSCIILHNMCVADRLMGDCRMRYDPAVNVLQEEDEAIQFPPDMQQIQHQENATTGDGGGGIGINGAPSIVKQLMARKERFQELDNLDEHVRLHQVLQKRCMEDWE